MDGRFQRRKTCVEEMKVNKRETEKKTETERERLLILVINLIGFSYIAGGPESTRRFVVRI